MLGPVPPARPRGHGLAQRGVALLAMTAALPRPLDPARGSEAPRGADPTPSLGRGGADHASGGPRWSRRSAWLGRLALVAVAGGAALAAASTEPGPFRGDRRDALAERLRGRGFRVEPSGVVFLDGPRGALGAATRPARALVAAAEGEEPTDLWMVETRLSPAGVLLAIDAVHDLTGTTGAEESAPVVVGERAAFVQKSLVPGAPTTIGVIDLAGQAVPGDFTTAERAQSAITAWQDTGLLRGVGRSTIVVDGEGEVSLAAAPGGIEVRRGGDRAVLDVSTPRPALPAWLQHQEGEVARPGNLVTWSVDRVRAVPWFGDEGMQAVKQVAFTALDFVLRNKEEITGDTGAEGIAEDLGGADGLAPPQKEIPVDPDLGWPPAPLEPWVTAPAIEGEGVWNAKVEEGFFRNQPNLPPVFLTTFIRSDRTRKATRVYVALWDPRRVELHMMAGTVEPKSATGKAGPGSIPRTPDVMKRVVAASNAGFQALHGEFGMMADGVVYLPPKPYAATVAATRDGSTVFGTWPNDGAIPDDIKSYRQNMTVMVQDMKFNPYDRTWWGGTVPGAEDKTHTVRTGICLTKEGFVAYLYGADLSPEALAQAMIQTRCVYGIALDMNAGHAGLEFYKVTPTAELGDVGRPLQRDWEAEGEVPGMDGWSFRARRMIRGMGLMSFPRYIKREARDYFYLALRHNLPGENVAPVLDAPFEGEGVWTVKGLPQHGFPYAIATTEVRPSKDLPDFRVRVLAIDPRSVAAPGAPALPGSAPPAKDAPTVLALDAGAGEGHAVVLEAGTFAVVDTPAQGAVVIARGGGDGSPLAAALGVADEAGFAYYVEPVTSAAPPPASGEEDAGTEKPAARALGEREAKAIVDLLTRLGCSQRIALPAPMTVALGGHTTLGGAAVHPPRGATAVTLVRGRAPGGRRFFEDTPVVKRDEWYKLQQHRVRYFKKAAE